MKKILNLTGVKELTREQQRNIKGARFNGCCSRNRCRISIPGANFCEPGRCTPYGCIFY